MALYEIDLEGTFVRPSLALANFLLGTGATADQLEGRRLAEFYAVQHQYDTFHKRLKNARGTLVTETVALRLPNGTMRCRCTAQWTVIAGREAFGGILSLNTTESRRNKKRQAEGQGGVQTESISVPGAVSAARRTSVWAGAQMLEFQVRADTLMATPWVGAENWARVLMISLKKWLLDRKKHAIGAAAKSTPVEVEARIDALKLYEERTQLEFFEQKLVQTVAQRNARGAAALYRYDWPSGSFLLRAEVGLPDGRHLPRQCLPNVDGANQISRGRLLDDGAWPLPWGERKAESEAIAWMRDSGRPVGFVWVPISDDFDLEVDWLQPFCEVAQVALHDAEVHATKNASVLAQDNAIRKLLISDRAGFYKTLLNILQSEVRVEGGSIFVVSRRHGEATLSLVASTGIEGMAQSNWDDVTYRLGEGLTGALARDRPEPVALVDISAERARRDLGPARFSEVSAHRATSFLGCPVFDDTNTLVGYVRLCNRRVGEGPIAYFSEQDVAIVQAIARIASVFFDLTNRQRLHEDALARSIHELTAPLVAVRAGASRIDDLLERNKLDKVRDIAKSITDDAALLIDLVNTMWLGSLDSTIRPEPTHLVSDVIKPLQRGMLQVARNRGFTDFLLDWSEALHHIPIVVDSRMMRQILYNLFVNAIKYGPREETMVRVAIGLSTVHNMHKIVVRDWGMGLDESEVTRIFDQYYRGPQAFQRDPTGSGLGLFIVKRLLQQHGGDITVGNLAQPTEFILTIPRGSEQ